MDLKKILLSAVVMLFLFTSFASAQSINPMNQLFTNYDAYTNYNDPSVDAPTSVDLPEGKGDVNQDSEIDLWDVWFLIDYIYNKGDAPNPLELADINEDERVNLKDITFLIKYLFDNEILVPEENAPVINLIDPDNDETFKTSKSDKTIAFKFRVTDESPINYCHVIVDGQTIETLERLKPERYEVSYELDRGRYDWQVSCTDIWNNAAESNVYDFDIKKKTSSKDKNDDREGVFYYSSKQKPSTQFSFDLPDDSSTIHLNQEQQKTPVNVGFLIAIILGVLCIVLFILVISVITSRKSY